MPDPGHTPADDTADLAAALEQFHACIGTNDANALREVLRALLVWSDRYGVDFEAACTRARGHDDAATLPMPEPV